MDDPFAELVNLLRPTGVLWKTIDARGRWGLQFDQNSEVNFGIVLTGSCLLLQKGSASKKIGPGDFLLQSRPDAYVIGSDEGVIAVNGEVLLARAQDRALRIGSGSARAVQILAGHFCFDTVNHDLLMEFLPRLVHIPAGSPSSAKLASLLAFIAEEAAGRRPAGTIIIQRAMEIILIEILRDRSLFSLDGQSGMIAGLADPVLRNAFKELHADPGAEWSVAKLAQVTGVSRTVFAEHFRRVVGVTPMEYLLSWRMTLAKNKLRRGSESLQQIASAIGYKSASSFSTAFSHRVGCSPKEFRKEKASARRY